MDVKGILRFVAENMSGKTNYQLTKETNSLIKKNVGHGVSASYYQKKVVENPHYRPDNIRGCIANAMASRKSFDFDDSNN
jgi:hypothetical protein